MVLPPPPVPAPVNVDDRTRMRLTSSRHKLTVARARKTILVRIEAVNRGSDPHDVAIRRVGGHRLATTGVVQPGKTRRFRIRLKPGRYVPGPHDRGRNRPLARASRHARRAPRRPPLMSVAVARPGSAVGRRHRIPSGTARPLPSRALASSLRSGAATLLVRFGTPAVRKGRCPSSHGWSTDLTVLTGALRDVQRRSQAKLTRMTLLTPRTAVLVGALALLLEVLAIIPPIDDATATKRHAALHAARDPLHRGAADGLAIRDLLVAGRGRAEAAQRGRGPAQGVRRARGGARRLLRGRPRRGVRDPRPNGAGKTTTVEILEGFRDADAGRCGTRASTGDGRTCLRARIGIVLQERRPPVPERARGRRAVRRLLPEPAPRRRGPSRRWGSPSSATRVRTLSGGQRRRLDVALGSSATPSCSSSTSRPPASTPAPGAARGR